MFLQLFETTLKSSTLRVNSQKELLLVILAEQLAPNLEHFKEVAPHVHVLGAEFVVLNLNIALQLPVGLLKV